MTTNSGAAAVQMRQRMATEEGKPWPVCVICGRQDYHVEVETVETNFGKMTAAVCHRCRGGREFLYYANKRAKRSWGKGDPLYQILTKTRSDYVHRPYEPMPVQGVNRMPDDFGGVLCQPYQSGIAGGNIVDVKMSDLQVVPIAGAPFAEALVDGEGKVIEVNVVGTWRVK